MTRDELIKQAYAYGASIALQEVGYSKTAADETAVKLAMSPVELKAAIMSMLQKGQAGVAGAGRAVGGAAQTAGGAVGGAAQTAGGAVADAARSVGRAGQGLGQGLKGIGRTGEQFVDPAFTRGHGLGEALGGAGRAVGGAAAGAGQAVGGAAQNVAGMPKELYRVLTDPGMSPLKAQRAAQLGLGAGALGGAGLGAGGVLGGQALFGGEEE